MQRAGTCAPRAGFLRLFRRCHVVLIFNLFSWRRTLSFQHRERLVDSVPDLERIAGWEGVNASTLGYVYLFPRFLQQVHELVPIWNHRHQVEVTFRVLAPNEVAERLGRRTVP